MRRGHDPARALALAAIRAYQRWLSPRKGFSCALRGATGGASCSAYGHTVIARFGLLRGLGLLDRRLALCGHVHRQSRQAPAPTLARQHRQRGACDPPCDLPCDGPCHGPGHLPCEVKNADCLCDLADCGCDLGERWRKRRNRGRTSPQLDALAERIRRRRRP